MANGSSDSLARFREPGRFLIYIWSRFTEDKCQDTAAALTYQTLFAVVPMLTVVYAAFSMIAAFSMNEEFSGLQQRIEDFVFSHFIPQTGTVVQEYLSTFSDQARQLTSVGLLFLLVTAFLMLSTIERAFNEIWKVDAPRKGLAKFLLYWAVLSLGPLLAGLGLVVSTFLVSLPLISDVAESVSLLQYVPVLLSVMIFTLIYAAVPNCNVLIRHAAFGGIVVAVLFEIAKKLFTWLVAQSSFELIYGAFASVPLFLAWVYLAWTLVLGGAELVRGLAVYDGAAVDEKEAPLPKVLLLLKYFHLAHLRGESLSEQAIVKSERHFGQEDWNTYRKLLLKLKLIKRLEGGDFILCKDLRTITLWQLQNDMPWPLPQQVLIVEQNWQTKLSEILQQVSSENATHLGISLDTLFSED